MKFKIKKYIYLINDVTNMILKKDRDAEVVKAEEDVKKLRGALIIISIALFVSLIFNIIFLLK